jgi:selenium-binding protein 1
MSGDLSCCGGGGGPGYKSPADAIAKGPKEKILYIQCIQPDSTKPDYLATVDVDPASANFCKVIHRLKMLHAADELHHSGWNACSSCWDKPREKRDKLILPCLLSDRIYIVDMADPLAPKHHKTIEPSELHALGLSTPHTSHCLENGEIMISTMGKPNGDGQGAFLVLDSKDDFKVKGVWSDKFTPWGYDFWSQVYFNVMISSEWGHPSAFKNGFNPQDVADGKYGKSLHVWNWEEKKIQQTIDLGADGWMPLETRFLHDPKKAHGFVGCALSSNVFHFHLEKDGKTWAADKVICIPALTVTGWALPSMPGLITDILISMDDRFLFFSCWAHGDIRCFNIENPAHPKQVGRIFIGGSIVKGGPVVVVGDEDNQPEQLIVKGRTIHGGPQMLQLSLDGKRLYVTTSLFHKWDDQFYPNQVKAGSVLLQVDVDCNGGLKINPDFLVDFGTEPDGAVLAHEVRYPGGDCSSDIFRPC